MGGGQIVFAKKFAAAVPGIFFCCRTRRHHASMHVPPVCTAISHTKSPFLPIFNNLLNHEIYINSNEILKLNYMMPA